MSQATRATSARERATIAAQYIRNENTSGRAFADCFEMGDGDEVVSLLLEKAKSDERIQAYSERCQWRNGQ